MNGEAERVWNSCKSLFYYNRVEETFRKEMEHSDVKKAFVVYLVAGLITAVLMVANAAELMYVAEFEYNTIAGISGAAEATVEWEGLMPVALARFLILVPFGLVFSVVYEGVAFLLFRLSGGKGTFAQHYYLSSIAAIGMAMLSFLYLLAPIPMVQMIGVVALIVLTMYFVFYVSVKAYETVHDVAFLHAFVIVSLLVVPRAFAMAFAMIAASSLFGLPTPALDELGV